MTPVAIKSTASCQHPVALTLWKRASIGQNSDVTHTRLNVIDRHRVDSLLFNKVVKKYR